MTAASLGVALWVALSGAAPAGTQLGSSLGDNRVAPWAVGVTAEQKQEAARLFDEGTASLEGDLYEEAANSFREALKHWNHPAIHYNLALALMHSNPLECHKELEAAMQYGPEPVEAEKYERAQRLLATVEKKLARIEITCDTPGARITLDSRKDPLVCPKNHGEWVSSGTHQLRVTRSGSASAEETFALKEGDKREQRLRYGKLWPRLTWHPWILVGAGAAAAVGGLLFGQQAGNQYQAFDALVKDCSQSNVNEGCHAPFPEGVIEARERGDLLHNAEVGFYVTAAVAATTGAVVLFLNQERPEFVGHVSQPKQGLTAVPMLGPGSGGLLLTFQF